MSTINASNFGDGTSSVPASAVLKGTAKALLDYNGNTNTVVGSTNVSSVTDNSAGNFTANFTGAFADADYLVGYSGIDTAGTAAAVAAYGEDSHAAGAAQGESVRLSDRVAADRGINHIVYHGDLA